MKLNEDKTVSLMIALYCRKNHGMNDSFCPSCASLQEYALIRLANCHLKPHKPLCSQCAIHCYAAEKRESIRRVMRFSGPRMLIRHPFMAFVYLMKKRLHSRLSISNTLSAADNREQH